MEVPRVKGRIHLTLFIFKKCYTLSILHAFSYFFFTFLFDHAKVEG